jgi:hypothetical protein
MVERESCYGGGYGGESLLEVRKWEGKIERKELCDFCGCVKIINC